MLSLLEQAMEKCKLVVLSVNCPDAMLGAMLRPGRIDDIVNVGAPEREVVERILGADADLAGEVEGLPICYVQDLAKRISALGRELAMGEIADLRAHAERVEAMTRRENGHEMRLTRDTNAFAAIVNGVRG